MSEPSKEVATVAPRQVEQAKVPVPLVGQLNDLDQAYRYAQALAQSNLLPKDLFGKPANVLTIILYGQQLNLTPMQAIQSIYVVNGRPSMSGQLWLSKVREAGHRAFVPCKTCGFAQGDHKPDIGHRYEADHDEKHCTFTIERQDTGEQHTETFTWANAERAKLAKKDIWQSYPKRMLMWRAVSNCATVICPEVALGFGAEEPEPVQERPTLAQVAAERQDRPVDWVEASSPGRLNGVPEPGQDPAEPDAEMVAELAEIEADNLGELRADDPDLFAGGEQA